MRWSDEQLERIYDRTDGRCHLCGKRIAWRNYGLPGGRGTWEVEHSRARAKGGTDHGNNLYGACIPCNREKGAGSTVAARRRHGRTRAPFSKARREEVRRSNAAGGAVVGGIFGFIAGPAGAAFGVVVGAALGYDRDPEVE